MGLTWWLFKAIVIRLLGEVNGATITTEVVSTAPEGTTVATEGTTDMTTQALNQIKAANDYNYDYYDGKQLLAGSVIEYDDRQFLGGKAAKDAAFGSQQLRAVTGANNDWPGQQLNSWGTQQQKQGWFGFQLAPDNTGWVKQQLIDGKAVDQGTQQFAAGNPGGGLTGNWGDQQFNSGSGGFGGQQYNGVNGFWGGRQLPGATAGENGAVAAVVQAIKTVNQQQNGDEWFGRQIIVSNGDDDGWVVKRLDGGKGNGGGWLRQVGKGWGWRNGWSSNDWANKLSANVNPKDRKKRETNNGLATNGAVNSGQWTNNGDWVWHVWDNGWAKDWGNNNDRKKRELTSGTEQNGQLRQLDGGGNGGNWNGGGGWGNEGGNWGGNGGWGNEGGNWGGQWNGGWGGQWNGGWGGGGGWGNEGGNGGWRNGGGGNDRKKRENANGWFNTLPEQTRQLEAGGNTDNWQWNGEHTGWNGWAGGWAQDRKKRDSTTNIEKDFLQTKQLDGGGNGGNWNGGGGGGWGNEGGNWGGNGGGQWNGGWGGQWNGGGWGNGGGNGGWIGGGGGGGGGGWGNEGGGGGGWGNEGGNGGWGNGGGGNNDRKKRGTDIASGNMETRKLDGGGNGGGGWGNGGGNWNGGGGGGWGNGGGNWGGNGGWGGQWNGGGGGGWGNEGGNGGGGGWGNEGGNGGWGNGGGGNNQNDRKKRGTDDALTNMETRQLDGADGGGGWGNGGGNWNGGGGNRGGNWGGNGGWGGQWNGGWGGQWNGGWGGQWNGGGWGNEGGNGGGWGNEGGNGGWGNGGRGNNQNDRKKRATDIASVNIKTRQLDGGGNGGNWNGGGGGGGNEGGNWNGGGGGGWGGQWNGGGNEGGNGGWGGQWNGGGNKGGNGGGGWGNGGGGNNQNDRKKRTIDYSLGNNDIQIKQFGSSNWLWQRNNNRGLDIWTNSRKQRDLDFWEGNGGWLGRMLNGGGNGNGGGGGWNPTGEDWGTDRKKRELSESGHRWQNIFNAKFLNSEAGRMLNGGGNGNGGGGGWNPTGEDWGTDRKKRDLGESGHRWENNFNRKFSTLNSEAFRTWLKNNIQNINTASAHDWFERNSRKGEDHGWRWAKHSTGNTITDNTTGAGNTGNTIDTKPVVDNTNNNGYINPNTPDTVVNVLGENKQLSTGDWSTFMDARKKRDLGHRSGWTDRAFVPSDTFQKHEFSSSLLGGGMNEYRHEFSGRLLNTGQDVLGQPGHEFSGWLLVSNPKISEIGYGTFKVDVTSNPVPQTETYLGNVQTNANNKKLVDQTSLNAGTDFRASAGPPFTQNNGLGILMDNIMQIANDAGRGYIRDV